MSLPTAIANVAGVATPEAVRPLRIGIGAGVLAALYLFAIYLANPVPDRVLAALGGPSDEVGRSGGLEMVWVPPRDAISAAIQGSFSNAADGARITRQGDAYLVRVPGVSAGDAELVAQRLTQGGGALRFHEVVQVPEMKRLGQVLGLPMNGRRPLDLEVEQWSAPYGRHDVTDYYMRADSRDDIDAALAKAALQGWTPPAGTHMAVQRLEPASTPSTGAWRSYVLSNRVELDGTAIADAQVSFDPTTNAPIVLLDFREPAAYRFGELTARLTGRKLAIVVDGLVQSAPIINEPIRGGRASITMGAGNLDKQQHDANVLVATLRAAGLPPGGELRTFRHIPPDDTTARVWLARMLLTVGGGLIVGILIWAAIRSFRPVRRRRQARAAGPPPWIRIAVTLLAPLAVWGIAHVPILGIDYGELEEIAGPQIKTVLNAGILGLTPLLTAYVLVELLALVIPGWRRRRHAGELARRPLNHAVYALAFVLVVVQGWAILTYLDTLGRGMGLGGGIAMNELSRLDRALVIASFAVATLVFGLVAHVIRRRGLGSGFAALLAGGWLVGIAWPWLKQEPLLSAPHVVGGATLVVMLVPLVVALRWRVTSAGEATLRVPTSGIAPIGDAAGLAVVVGLLGTLPFTEVTARASELVMDITSSHQLVYGLVVVATVLWSWAFARPRLLTAIASRAGVAVPQSSTFWRAVGLSTSLLVFVLTPAMLTYLYAGKQVGTLTDPISIGIVAAVIVDIVDDLRARRSGLDVAWSLQHAQHADLVAHDLESAGIPHHLSASHVRTLLAFFGPYAPIDVLVPPAHVVAARDRIAKLLAS